jgi:hypothetical protein
VSDLLDVLAFWGTWGAFGPCDIDLDGDVDLEDLLGVMSAWGGCP